VTPLIDLRHHHTPEAVLTAEIGNPPPHFVRVLGAFFIFAPDFTPFAEAGRRLAELHLNYEALEPYALQFIETLDVPLSYVVADKMKLSQDKTSLRVNASLTLSGIPQEVFGYRLGNRPALEWVIDQYRVTEDARSGIRSDPNRPDDPEYIVRLVGQVIRVNLETVKIVADLPEMFSS
jgi:predicted helicase